MVKKPVRVRIPPSPTGHLHIGTARTALFNWLFAKKHNGVFILRIEDTDEERSRKEYEEDIMEGLKWLGMEWDEGPAPPSGEFPISPPKADPPPADNFQFPNKYIGDYGPYRQSERGEIYEKYIKKLLDENLAYYCFCTKEDLEAERESMLANGQAPRYSGRCRNLPKIQAEKKLAAGESYAIRFKMPETEISFTDIVRGKISFDMSLVGDIVIAKDEKSALYNLAVVIDDFEMKITHVVRGEDHLANTPKQIAIMRALGFPIPEFAHIPLILNPDRSKMSKRFEAVAIADYRKEGYLPEALINFMALLGWHPEAEINEKTKKTEEREILTKKELIEKFSLERVQKGGAVFNKEKLDWLNGQYLRSISNETLLKKIGEVSRLPADFPKEKLIEILEITKERMKKLSDFKEFSGFFFEISDYPKKTLIWKGAGEDQILKNLNSLFKILSDLPNKDWTAEKLLTIVNDLAGDRGRGEVFWPLRAALSGREASPGPIEIAEILGKKETLKRIEAATKKLGSGEQNLNI